MIALLVVAWPASASGESWPDPACDLPAYESVTADPFVMPLPRYLQRKPLTGDEAGIQVIRISGNPGQPVGPAAPGKVWPEVLTHRYSLVDPCNADATMCLLDVDRNCEDVGLPGAPSYECRNTPLGPLILDAVTLRPVLELADPGDEDWRWHPTDPARMIYVNESGEVGHLDVASSVATPLRDFGLEYASLEIGGGGSKSNPSQSGERLALLAQRRLDGQLVCFAYDLASDLKGPDVVVEPQTWCGMSQLGEILTVYFRNGSSRPGQIDAYDLQGNLLASFPENQHPSHWAFTVRDPFGAAEEVVVGRQKVPGQDPHILRSLTTAAITQLDVGFGWSHTSTTLEPEYRGWAITSQLGFDGRIGLVSQLADPSGDGDTRFVAFARSDRRADEGQIETHSEPTCASFGQRRIVCSSNWHSQVALGEGVGSFVWDLSAPGGPCRDLPDSVWPRTFPACDDGLDNDGDGLVDLDDPVCERAIWEWESQPCQDGLDNDGDGRIDFDGGLSFHGAGSPELTSPDAGCLGIAWKPGEADERRSCGLGFGLSLGMLLLLAARQRRRASPRGDY